VKIRILGTRDEIDAVVGAVAVALDIRERSEFYPNRNGSRLGRVYLDTSGPKASS
jgi:hypothetical protein